MNFSNLLTVKIGWNEIFIELIVLLVIMFLLTIIYIIFEKKVYKQFSLMNYEYVLKHKKLLLYANKRSNKKYQIFLILAVSSYEIGNSLDFEYYIEQVKCDALSNSVFYWKAYYHFFNGDEVEFLNCLENLKKLEPSDINKSYIQILTLLMKKQKNETISENELLILNQTFSKKIKDYIKSN